MPQLIQWTDAMDVRNEEINGQHKTIIKLINELYTAAMYSAPELGLRKKFESLRLAVLEHFDTEERYFREFKYAGAQKHIQEHGELRTRFYDCQEMLQSGDMLALVTFAPLILSWYEKHLLETDQAYAGLFGK